MLFVTPAYWLDLRSLAIANARYGQPINMAYDREFYREFFGAWNVSIWRNQRGEWAAYCGVSGEWPYKAGKPDPDKTLEWLVDGDKRCTHLPPGDYRVDVRITANPGGVFARTGLVSSNVFAVMP